MNNNSVRQLARMQHANGFPLFSVYQIKVLGDRNDIKKNDLRKIIKLQTISYIEINYTTKAFSSTVRDCYKVLLIIICKNINK